MKYDLRADGERRENSFPENVIVYVINRYYHYTVDNYRYNLRYSVHHIKYILQLYKLFLNRVGIGFLYKEARNMVQDSTTNSYMFSSRRRYITVGEKMLRIILSIRAVLKKYGIIDPIAQERSSLY